MAEIKEPQKVLPIAGLIFAQEFEVDGALQVLQKDLGDILLTSDIISFTHTTYYSKEMGDNLLRQWCVFENLMLPDVLPQLKHRTNVLEKKYLNEKGHRKVNIDPGLLSLSNLILASTKNYSHRIYLGDGIYGEVTLIYKKKTFSALDWTYPDYREKNAIVFFTRARELLKEKIPINLRNSPV